MGRYTRQHNYQHSPLPHPEFNMSLTVYTLFAGLTTWLLPIAGGYIALCLRNPELERWTLAPRVTISLFAGMALWSAVCLGGYLMSASLFTSALLFCITCLAFVSLRLRFTTRQHSKIPTNRLIPPQELFLLAMGAAIVLIMHPVGTHQLPTDDTFRHLVFIRRIYESGQLSRDIFITSVTAPFTLLNANYAYDTIYPLYALTAHLTGQDPAWVVMKANYFLAIPALFGIYTAGKLFSDNARTGLICAMALMLFWIIFPFKHLRSMMYPSAIGDFLAFIGLVLLLYRKDHMPVHYIFLLAIGSASAGLIHTQSWAFSGIMGGLAGVTSLTFKRWDISKRLLLWAAFFFPAALMLTLPRLEFYFSMSGDFGEILFSRYEHKVWNIGPLYALMPQYVFDLQILLTTTASAWLLLANWRQVRKDYHRYLAVTAAVVVLASVCFLMLPPIFTLLSEVASTSIAHRLKRIASTSGGMPMFGVLAVGLGAAHLLSGQKHLAFLYRSADMLCSIPPGWKNQLRICLLAAAIVSIAHFIPLTSFSTYKFDRTMARYSSRIGPTITQIMETPEFSNMVAAIPSGAAVISDNPELIAAFRNIQITGSFHALTPATVQVKQQIKNLFKKTTPLSERKALLADLPGEYLVLSPKVSHLAETDFNQMPAQLTLVYDKTLDNITVGNRRFVIYRINPAAMERDPSEK